MFYFYAPGLKGPPGASSNGIICLSVHLSVSNSVPLTNKVQYLKLGWSCSNQTWTVSSFMGSSHFTDITCPWGGGQNVGLRDFCHILTLLPSGASVFHKHILVSLSYFYAPGLKGLRGASSVWIVCPSVCPSVIPSRLQTKCNTCI